MKVIRNAVFETNSSSSHSISVGKNIKKIYDYNFPMNKSGKVPLIFGLNYDFGWGITDYRDAYAKLNYLACIAFETNKHMLRMHNRPYISKVEDVLKIKDICKLEKIMQKNVKGFTGFTLTHTDDIFYKYDGNPNELILSESVDHQMWEDFSSLEGFLKYFKITIENFIFNPKVVLHISNDNLY